MAYTPLREQIDVGITTPVSSSTEPLAAIPPNSRFKNHNFTAESDRQRWWTRIIQSHNLSRSSIVVPAKAPSPFSSTDYIRRTEKITCCSSAWRLLSHYRAKRSFNIVLCVLSSLILSGLILFFIFPRNIHLELYNFNDSLVRICNYTAGVNVTIENLQTVFSLSNPNYFPVKLKDSKAIVGLRNSNMTLRYFYDFELVQKVDEECEQRTYCTGLASSVDNWVWRINEISKFGLVVLEDSCKTGNLLLQVVVQQYVYQFLGQRQVKVPSVVKKIFSTTCEGCAINPHPTKETPTAM